MSPVHSQAMRFVYEQTKGKHFNRAVEIGGRNVNGTVRNDIDTDYYLSTDLLYGPGVDVVADGAVFQLTRSVDLVLCLEVFEHCPSWPLIVKNAWKMLNKGGLFIATCAGVWREPHSGLDGGQLTEGEWYRNVPFDELARSLVIFEGGRSIIDASVDLYAEATK